MARLVPRVLGRLEATRANIRDGDAIVVVASPGQ